MTEIEPREPRPVDLDTTADAVRNDRAGLDASPVECRVTTIDAWSPSGHDVARPQGAMGTSVRLSLAHPRGARRASQMRRGDGTTVRRRLGTVHGATHTVIGLESVSDEKQVQLNDAHEGWHRYRHNEMRNLVIGGGQLFPGKDGKR